MVKGGYMLLVKEVLRCRKEQGSDISGGLNNLEVRNVADTRWRLMTKEEKEEYHNRADVERPDGPSHPPHKRSRKMGKLCKMERRV